MPPFTIGLGMSFPWTPLEIPNLPLTFTSSAWPVKVLLSGSASKLILMGKINASSGRHHSHYSAFQYPKWKA